MHFLCSRFLRRFRFPFSRYRVVTVSSPRVASQYSADGKVHAFERAMLAQCLHSILAACGGKSARWRCQWRYACLIEPYGQNQDLAQKPKYGVHGVGADCAILSNKDTIFAVTSCDGWCLSVSQMNAMSRPDDACAMSSSLCLFSLYASRIWRFTLFLSTAWRKRFLETETRMRIPASSVCLYTMRIGYADRDLLSVPVKRASIDFLLQSLSAFFRPKPLSIMLFQVCVQG